jgi:putative ABC transport system permease protein
MRIALRELRRRPGRFAVAAGALVALTVLLLLLGGLLDGLFLGSTGAIRAQNADVFVYSSDVRESLVRSRVTAEQRAQVEQVPGVGQVGGLGVSLVAGRVPGRSAVIDVAVFGYEVPPAGVPASPPAGQAYADRRLASEGVSPGTVLQLGPRRISVSVIGMVEDTSYLLQGGLWVAPETWRSVQRSARPDQALAPGTFQVLVVQAAPKVGPAALADRIDAATGGTTSSLTKSEAVLSLPGTSQQRSVFNALIGVTLFVAGLVSALFFALLTIERAGLYATLKAVGARNLTLVGGLVLQAALVATVAFCIGAALSYALGAVIPPGVPVQLERSRAVTTGVLLVITAAVGGAVSLRRLVRIDPASVIG